MRSPERVGRESVAARLRRLCLRGADEPPPILLAAYADAAGWRPLPAQLRHVARRRRMCRGLCA